MERERERERTNPGIMQATSQYTAQLAQPLPNPALSFIHHLLLNDDDDSPLSSADLEAACHSRASELAAILQEDSPALSFNSAFNPQDAGTPFRYAAPPLNIASAHHPCEEGNCAVDASTIISNEVLVYHAKASKLAAISKQASPALSIDFRFSEPTVLPRAVPQSLAPPPPNFLPSIGLDVRVFGSLADDEENYTSYVNDGHIKSHRNMNSSKPGKKTSTSSNAGTSQGSYVDLNDMLFQCAYAITSNDTRLAMHILSKMRQHVSPHGNGAERLAYYLVEALDARLSGTGWQYYLGYMQKQRPPSKQILKASFRCYSSSCPISKASHFFAIQTILDAAKGASVLHILEYQLTGVHYPSLFKALAARPGGPPQVRLVGFNAQHYSILPSEMEVVLEVLEETGHQLSLCAASYGVPFRFTSWVGDKQTFRWLDFASPTRRQDEVLVVLSMSPLRYIMDDSSDSPLLRAEGLDAIQASNADVYIQGIVTGSYSTPFFSRRFKEALFHFERVYDMLDTYVGRGNTDRRVFESEVLGKALLNLVACEGACMSERVAGYKNWKALSEESGLRQLPLNQEIRHGVQNILKSWHKEYIVIDNLQYLLMGWKGRMLYALSTWRSSNRAASRD